MKRVFSVLLIILFVISMSGCHDTPPEGSTASSTTQQLETKPPVSEAPTNPHIPEDSAPEHIHEWIHATCTEPIQCQCGETKGQPMGHTWRNATCTAPKTCTTCNETSGTPLDHTYADGVCTSCGAAAPHDPKPEVSHTHKDQNADKKCDICSESVVVVIDFYAMNDLHGKFCDSDTQPGVDELASYLKSRKDTDDHTLFLSSGDMWQGAAESNLTKGLILTEWMNAMGFVSMTLGNHEYDWGEDAIRKNQETAGFPLLAINIYDRSTGKPVNYCTPSVVVERDGVQIGIIGAIGDCYSSISKERVEDVEFKVGSQLTALVKSEATRLRSQGVDIIVYSLHDGHGSSTSGSISNSTLDNYYDPSLSDGYIDLVFEGHSHKSYVLTDSHGVYHLQGGGDNEGICHAEISFNLVTEEKEVTAAEIIRSSVYSKYADDPETEALEEKYADIIDSAYNSVGRISRKLSSSTIADIVSELYLEAGLERWGNQYDIVLGGGYIKTRSPYDLAAGDVTYSDILSLLPFDNQLVLCKISGSKLKSKFINNSSYHNTYSSYGNSIKNRISNSGTYYIVVDMYTAVYAPNGLTIVDYYDEGVYARDLLAEEIRSGRLS